MQKCEPLKGCEIRCLISAHEKMIASGPDPSLSWTYDDPWDKDDDDLNAMECMGDMGFFLLTLAF